MEGSLPTSVSSVFKRVAQLTRLLSREEKEKLIETLKHDMLDVRPPRTKGFRGMWRARFPDDIDLGACLQAIRDESKRELEEIA
jgi:hypothetical protein